MRTQGLPSVGNAEHLSLRGAGEDFPQITDSKQAERWPLVWLITDLAVFANQIDAIAKNDS